MPGRVTPLKKPRNTTHLPLALNPMKSQDVLAVLAERNEAVMPVGAWVEPAPPNFEEIPAHTSAYIIEGELKEQQRRKQEALKHFQRQVKYRVNQQIWLRKKQQLQKSYEAVDKEGSIAMRSSDRAFVTPKRTSVFPSHLNAAIGSSMPPPSQMIEDTLEDGENHSELFQQAQALSHTMKQARHQLASFKTTAPSEKPENNKINTETREFPLKIHQDLVTTITHYQNFVENQESDSEEISSDRTYEKQKALICGNQQDLLSEDKDKSLSRVQGLQDILPEAQDCLLETQTELSVEIQSVKLSSPRIEADSQATGPEANAEKTETLSTELEAGNVEINVQDLLSKCHDQDSLSKDHCVLSEDQNILSKYQDQNFLPKTCHIFPKEQNILFKSQDQHFLQGDQDFLLRDQYVLPKSQSISCKYQNQDFLPTDQNILPKCEDQEFIFKDQNILHQYREHDFQSKNQKVRFQEPFSDRTGEKGRDVSSVDYQYLPSKFKFQDFLGDQSLYFGQKLSVGTAERCRDFPLDGHQHLPNRHQRETCRRRQVWDEDQSGLSTEFQVSLAFQSGVDQEEDKKERQKQYLRYRRLFMDIEREQVKEQKREREQKKKIEKIKKRKEQQRFAEEQRILKMKCQKETYPEENMSDILAQLQLEEIKGAREKQQQKEKEYIRYVEALRAQVQEKMKLYNITLPPLCCCGPDFWDAHPDTCANNCIFYKNHRAYNRALHSVINSSDISEGNSTLRSAIRNFASANRRTLKRISNKNLKSTETATSISTL